MSDLKTQLLHAFKDSIITAREQRVDDFINLLETFIESKQPVPEFKHDPNVLYGIHNDRQADEDYEQYMDEHYAHGDWTD